MASSYWSRRGTLLLLLGAVFAAVVVLASFVLTATTPRALGSGPCETPDVVVFDNQGPDADLTVGYITYQANEESGEHVTGLCVAYGDGQHTELLTGNQEGLAGGCLQVGFDGESNLVYVQMAESIPGEPEPLPCPALVHVDLYVEFAEPSIALCHYEPEFGWEQLELGSQEEVSGHLSDHLLDYEGLCEEPAPQEVTICHSDNVDGPFTTTSGPPDQIYATHNEHLYDELGSCGEEPEPDPCPGAVAVPGDSQTQVIYTPPPGMVVSSVCVSHVYMGGEGSADASHSLPISEDGFYDSCYSVEGIGDASLTVTVGSGECFYDVVDHLDIYLAPAPCADAFDTVTADGEGGSSSLTYNATDGMVVSAVCIAYDEFDLLALAAAGGDHTGPLSEDGGYEPCLNVAGLGTASATVSVPSEGACADLLHMDVYIEEAPDFCTDADVLVDGGGNDEVTYNAPDGQYVAGVCAGIGSGEVTLQGEGGFEHDGPTFSDGGFGNCSAVSGIGSPSITVSVGGGEGCPGIDHLDVYLDDIPCADADQTVFGEGSQLTYQAPPGMVISEVCVGLNHGGGDVGFQSVGSDEHVGPVTNGTHAGGCLEVSGVGTGSVTAQLLSGECPTGIDHLDVYLESAPPTPTPTPPPPTPTQPPTTPTPPVTPTPVVEGPPSPTPTAVPSPSPTPVVTPTPNPTTAPTATATPPAPTPTPVVSAPTATPPAGEPTQPAGGAPPSNDGTGGDPPPTGDGTPPFVVGGPLFSGAQPTPTPTFTPASTATPTPAPTTSPTATPTPRATATATPASGTATPTSTAIPGSGGDDGGGGSTFAAGGASGARTQFAESVPKLSDLSTSGRVVLTNLLLGLIALLLILLACAVFNGTLKERGNELMAAFAGVLTPLGAIGQGWHAVSARLDDPTAAFPLVRLTLIVVLISVIYTAIDPSFGWNLSTLAMLISLAIGLGVLTVVYEGAQVVLSSRRFGLEGTLQLHPLGVVVAILSVLASRFTDLHPGVVLGFVAGASVAARDPREAGQLTFIPMLILLSLSLMALALIDPFRALSDESSQWLAVVPETAAVTIFVGGIEGLLFNLVPLTFMEGKKIWDWNKIAWLGLAGTVSFFFFHVLLNRTNGYADALADADVQALFAMCFVFLAVAGAFWYACRTFLPETDDAVAQDFAEP
jgi:hypothetical protein